MSGPLITQQIDNIIKELIKVLDYLPHLCEMIREKVNEQYLFYRFFTSNLSIVRYCHYLQLINYLFIRFIHLLGFTII
jgi:hypothetical protein